MENEKEALHAKTCYTAKKLQTLHQALQNATAEFEQQQRCTNKAVSDATNRCNRINTSRSIKKYRELKDFYKY